MKWIIAMIVTWMACASSLAEELDKNAQRELAEKLCIARRMPDRVAQTLALWEKRLPGEMAQADENLGAHPGSTNLSWRAKIMVEVVRQELQWDKVKEGFVTLFAETFTKEEMIGLIAFYESPAGRAFVAKEPELERRQLALDDQKLMEIWRKVQAAIARQEMRGVSGSSDNDQSRSR